jgi:hypothetical protein
MCIHSGCFWRTSIMQLLQEGLSVDRVLFVIYAVQMLL